MVMTGLFELLRSSNVKTGFCSAGVPLHWDMCPVRENSMFSWNPATGFAIHVGLISVM